MTPSERRVSPREPLSIALRPFLAPVGLLALCLFFGWRQPAFLSPENFFNVLNAVAIVGILAIGQAFPLISGGFDLSQGAVASLTGTAVAMLLSRHEVPIPLALALGGTLGALLGILNGTLISRLGINPFVATLGTQIAFFGLTNVVTNNQPVALGPDGEAFRQIAFGRTADFSNATLVLLATVAVLGFVLRYLPFGQHLYALGGNEEAVRLAGLPSARLKTAAYAVSGFTAAVAGVVMIARAGQASPTAGVGYELQSLASCIVGGIALGGGVGSAWNVLVGTLTLGVIDTGLDMAVNAPNWRPVIRGGIILLAVGADARARARRDG